MTRLGPTPQRAAADFFKTVDRVALDGVVSSKRSLLHRSELSEVESSFKRALSAYRDDPAGRDAFIAAARARVGEVPHAGKWVTVPVEVIDGYHEASRQWAPVDLRAQLNQWIMAAAADDWRSRSAAKSDDWLATVDTGKAG